MVGLADYSNATKQTWRGWQWNRIVDKIQLPHCKRRLSPRELSAKTVLYLVGPDDADRRAACAKGFSEENLIAIDIDEANINRVRSRGGIGICAALEDVLIAWPDDWKIDCVIADMCCGIDKVSAAVTAAILTSTAILPTTAVSVNMQRGRDAISKNVWSDIARRYRRNSRHTGRMTLPSGDAAFGHRGICWYTWFLAIACRLCGVPDSSVLAAVQDADFYSYRSNKVYMDSSVFRVGISFVSTATLAARAKAARVFWKTILKTTSEPSDSVFAYDKIASVRRQISAARAVRTVKLQHTCVAKGDA